MLLIRQSQIDHLACSTKRTLALTHVQRHFPAICKSLNPSHLTPLVSNALQRAAAHGFQSDADLLTFVDLAVVLGDDFDTRFAWARAILDDHSPDTRPFRAVRLYEEAMTRLGDGDETDND